MSKIKFEVGAVYSYAFTHMSEQRGLFKVLDSYPEQGHMLIKEYVFANGIDRFREGSVINVVQTVGNSLALQYSNPATVAECMQFQLLEDAE